MNRLQFREYVEEHSVPRAALLLGISETEVNYRYDPMRCPSRAWAQMLRDEGLSNEEIAVILDLEFDSVLEFLGERPAAAQPRLVRQSAYEGVKHVDGKWEAWVKINNCWVTLGRFDDEISAAHVRDDTIYENHINTPMSRAPERRSLPR